VPERGDTVQLPSAVAEVLEVEDYRATRVRLTIS